MIPSKNPNDRICKMCGVHGCNKWDGGIKKGYFDTKTKQLVIKDSIEYICYKCDVYNKWFELTEEDFEEEAHPTIEYGAWFKKKMKDPVFAEEYENLADLADEYCNG